MEVVLDLKTILKNRSDTLQRRPGTEVQTSKFQVFSVSEKKLNA
jgi:hypothetical protein